MKQWNGFLLFLVFLSSMTAFASTVTKISPVHVISKPAVVKDIFLDKAVSYQNSIYALAMLDFRWPIGVGDNYVQQGEQLAVLKIDAVSNEFSLLTEVPNLYFKDGTSYSEMLKELAPLSITGDELLVNGYKFSLNSKTFNTASAKTFAPTSFVVPVNDLSGQASCIGSVIERDLLIDCLINNNEPFYSFKLKQTQGIPTIWVRDNHLIVQASDKFYRVADDNQPVLVGQLPQALANFSVQSVNQKSALLIDKTTINAINVEFELHLYNFSDQLTQQITINAGIGAPIVAMPTTDDNHQIGFYAKTAERASKVIRVPAIQKILADASIEVLWQGSEFESVNYGEKPPTVAKAGTRWLWNFSSGSATREYQSDCAHPTIVLQTTSQFNCLPVPKLQAKLLESNYYSIYLTSWQRQLFWRESGQWTENYSGEISSSVLKRLHIDTSVVDVVQSINVNDGRFGKRQPIGWNLDNFIQTNSSLWLSMFSGSPPYPFLFSFDRDKKKFAPVSDAGTIYNSHRYQDNIYSLNRLDDMSFDFKLRKLDLNTGKFSQIADIVNSSVIGFVGDKLAVTEPNTDPNSVGVSRLINIDTGERSAALITLKKTSRELEGELRDVTPVGFLQQNTETWLIKNTSAFKGQQQIDELQAQKIDLQHDTFLSEPIVIERRIGPVPLSSTSRKNILLFDDIFLNGTTAISTSGITLPEDHTPIYRTAKTYGEQLIAFNPQLTVYNKQNLQFKIQSQIRDLITYPIYSMIGDKLYFLAFDAKEGLGIYQTTINNPSPIAMPDFAETDDRSDAILDVLKNDSDAGGDIIRLNFATTAVGKVIVNSEQKLRFTPERGFNGAAEISYTISDTDGAKATALATVMVKAKPNQQPVAVADQATTDHLNSVLIDVLANDTDADQDKLELVSASVNTGTVSITNDQKLNFIPANGFNGVATIQYQIRDAYLGHASGVVEVRVNGPIVDPVKDTTATSNGGAFPLGFLGLFFVAAWRHQRSFLRRPTCKKVYDKIWTVNYYGSCGSDSTGTNKVHQTSARQ